MVFGRGVDQILRFNSNMELFGSAFDRHSICETLSDLNFLGPNFYIEMRKSKCVHNV